MKTLLIDKDRYMIKTANLDKITGKWKDAVDAAIDVYKKVFGESLVSVYVGGSVACGEAIESKSDIDTYAVLNIPQEKVEEIVKTTLDGERLRLDSEFPFLTKFEMHAYSLDILGIRKQFQLRILAVCVYGKNFDADFPNYPLTRETFQKVRISMSGDIEKARLQLQKADLSQPEYSKYVATGARWVAKRLIRNAGTLALWKENFYTMNVPMMAEIFAEAYPDKKAEIGVLLSWVENPPSDANVVLNVLDTFGKWLIEEDERVFGKME
ncbi:MAG: hypothetical protein K9M11_04720 [Candidatus Pacebacteria bacterium]|nr:hypothetical protein [Candidatus Paceibacterota bacterium]